MSYGKKYTKASVFGSVTPGSASRPGTAVSSDKVGVHNSAQQNGPQESYVGQQVHKLSGQDASLGTGIRWQRNVAIQGMRSGYSDATHSTGAGFGRSRNPDTRSVRPGPYNSQARYGTDGSVREEYDTSADSSRSRMDQTAGIYTDTIQSSDGGLSSTKILGTKSLYAGSSSTQRGYGADDSTTDEQDISSSKTFRAGMSGIKEPRKEMDENFVNTQLPVSLPVNTVKLFEALQPVGELLVQSRMELETLLRELTKDDSDKLKRKIEVLEKEVERLNAFISKKENDLEEATKVTDSALAQLEEIRKDKTQLEVTMKQQKVEIEKIAVEFKNLQNELGRKQTQLDKSLKDNKQILDELSNNKSRLSKLMGSRLADNNPEIADLSDKNRPTKLAEKFQELYDNEWTDAFEVSEELFTTDRKGIEVLKSVLENVKAHCDHLSNEQTKTLAESVTMTSTNITKLSPDVLKQIKDLKKVNAELSLTGVYEQYMRSIQTMPVASKDVATFVQDPRVQQFVEKCVKLCWLMCVQDPPVVFGPDADLRRPTDTNTYKFYTKTGNYVDYVVWPPLLLHEGGPILCKGVVQGCDRRIVPDQEYETGRGRDQEASTGQRRRRNLPPTEEKSPSSITDQHKHASSSKMAANATDYHAVQKPAMEESATHKSNVSPKDVTQDSTSESKHRKSEVTPKIEFPTQEDWDKFCYYGDTYGWDDSTTKARMGRNYQICRNYLRKFYNI